MSKYYIRYLLTLVTFATVAQGSLLTDLESAFDVSRIPNEKEVMGVWAGRCADVANPDAAVAAILVFKTVPDETTFPPERATMSYFQSNQSPANFFDSMTANEALNYPPAKEWFSKEQWRRASVQGGSLVNSYSMDGGVEMERSLRMFEDEFQDRILLRVRRIEGAQSAVQRFCYFTKKLGSSPVSPVTPVNENVLAIANVSGTQLPITVMNSLPNDAFRWVEVRNIGLNSIQIDQYRTLLFNGGMVEELLSYVLPPGHAMRHTIATGQNYRFKAVQFLATGVGRLQISAIRNP